MSSWSIKHQREGYGCSRQCIKSMTSKWHPFFLWQQHNGHFDKYITNSLHSGGLQITFLMYILCVLCIFFIFIFLNFFATFTGQFITRNSSLCHEAFKYNTYKMSHWPLCQIYCILVNVANWMEPYSPITYISYWGPRIFLPLWPQSQNRKEGMQLATYTIEEQLTCQHFSFDSNKMCIETGLFLKKI